MDVLNTYSFDDWVRELTACAAAADCAYPLSWKEAKACLTDNEIIGEPQQRRLLAVASALGIAERIRRDWNLTSTGRSGSVHIGDELAGLGYVWKIKRNDTWEGWARHTVESPIFRVFGHPDRGSAIEHLERLIGRVLP